MASTDFESIRSLVRSFFVNPKLDDDSDLWDSHVLDSLSIVELLLFLQEKLQLDVFSEEITQENFSTINRISQYFYNRLESASTSE